MNSEHAWRKDTGGELILIDVLAGRMMGGFNAMGGRLYLTPKRLYFVPLIRRANLKKSSAAAGLAADLRGWDFHPQQFLNFAIMPLTGDIDMPLDRVVNIEPKRKFSLNITCNTSGSVRVREFAIFTGGWNRREECIQARDRLLTEVLKARKSLPHDPGKTGS